MHRRAAVVTGSFLKIKMADMQNQKLVLLLIAFKNVLYLCNAGPVCAGARIVPRSCTCTEAHVTDLARPGSTRASASVSSVACSVDPASASTTRTPFVRI